MTQSFAELKATYPNLHRAYVAQFHRELGPNEGYRTEELHEYVENEFAAPMRPPHSCTCGRGGNPAYCECQDWAPEFAASQRLARQIGVLVGEHVLGCADGSHRGDPWEENVRPRRK